MLPYDVAIIGGGIVGLSTAYQILQQAPATRLLLIEKEDRLAKHQTGRNSGVIHSGIYYKPGSLKALNCREGYRLLLKFCRAENIPYEICGKIVVATEPEELPRLQTLYERGLANGLEGIRWLEKEQISEHEPHATGIRALHVPETGIIDYTALAQRLGTKIRERGGQIQLGETVCSIQGNTIATNSNSYLANKVCACAGLHSDRLAIESEPDLPLRIIPFRGEYYDLVPEKQHLVRNLVYPVPDPAFPFLGVHFTRMVGGGIEAGPNAVLALAREGYSWGDINLRDLSQTLAWPGFWTLARKFWKTGYAEIHRSLSKATFARTLQKLIPEIQASDLVSANAGVRAQACHLDGSLLDDFHIIQRKNALHLCNAPSPAATASLAIGKTIAQRLIN